MHQAISTLSDPQCKAEADQQLVTARNSRTIGEPGALEADLGVTRLCGGWRGRVDMSRFDTGDIDIAREFGDE